MTDWAAPEAIPPSDSSGEGLSATQASLRSRRVHYETAGLDIADVDAEPVIQWSQWHQDAYAGGVVEPNSMTISTIGLDGIPDSRIVLVREADRRGLVFYTNYNSAKSLQLDASAGAAAVFSWLDLHRQVRLRARVERVATEESEAYFASRPRASQLGAWASPQSGVIAGRAELEARVIGFDEQFADSHVPRPPHWGGWRIVPFEWEFWQGRPNRLHDRIRYRRSSDSSGAEWQIERLAP
jgi:pyridoxamine 5'-phosphate oxidase